MGMEEIIYWETIRMKKEGWGQNPAFLHAFIISYAIITYLASQIDYLFIYLFLNLVVVDNKIYLGARLGEEK